MIDKFKYELTNFDGTRLAIAFADIRFKFPDNTLYPCLSVRHDKYGLIQPLEGRTVATLTEVHLAIHQGAKIEYIEAFVLFPKTTKIENYTSPKNIFRDNLKELIDARDKAKLQGDDLKQLLFKLINNTQYGKVAQGVNPKNSWDIRDGDIKTLGESLITQPYFASMITGTLRAGLSALLVAIDELNKYNGHNYKVISATTDGMLYTVTTKSGIKFENCLKSNYKNDIKNSLENGNNIFNSFEQTDPILFKKCLEFPVLRLLQSSRNAWGYNEFIEIKHAVNKVLNIKTRGQIGAYCE